MQIGAAFDAEQGALLFPWRTTFWLLAIINKCPAQVVNATGGTPHKVVKMKTKIAACVEHAHDSVHAIDPTSVPLKEVCDQIAGNTVAGIKLCCGQLHTLFVARDITCHGLKGHNTFLEPDSAAVAGLVLRCIVLQALGHQDDKSLIPDTLGPRTDIWQFCLLAGQHDTQCLAYFWRLLHVARPLTILGLGLNVNGLFLKGHLLNLPISAQQAKTVLQTGKMTTKLLARFCQCQYCKEDLLTFFANASNIAVVQWGAQDGAWSLLLSLIHTSLAEHNPIIAANICNLNAAIVAIHQQLSCFIAP